jgi:predicted nucleic acid-binding Zn ribbon protein
MQMSEGQIYRCQNIECGCEVRVVKTSVETSANTRCGCGAFMKKPYTPPILRVLSDIPVLSGRRADEN